MFVHVCSVLLIYSIVNPVSGAYSQESAYKLAAYVTPKTFLKSHILIHERKSTKKWSCGPICGEYATFWVLQLLNPWLIFPSTLCRWWWAVSIQSFLLHGALKQITTELLANSLQWQEGHIKSQLVTAIKGFCHQNLFQQHQAHLGLVLKSVLIFNVQICAERLKS